MLKKALLLSLLALSSLNAMESYPLGNKVPEDHPMARFRGVNKVRSEEAELVYPAPDYAAYVKLKKWTFEEESCLVQGICPRFYHENEGILILKDPELVNTVRIDRVWSMGGFMGFFRDSDISRLVKEVCKYRKPEKSFEFFEYISKVLVVGCLKINPHCPNVRTFVFATRANNDVFFQFGHLGASFNKVQVDVLSIDDFIKQNNFSQDPYL